MSASHAKDAARRQLNSYTPVEEPMVDLDAVSAPAGLRGLEAVRPQLRADMLSPHHEDPVTSLRSTSGRVRDLENPRGYK